MTKETKVKLKQFCQSTGQKQSDVIDRAVEFYLEYSYLNMFIGMKPLNLTSEQLEPFSPEAAGRSIANMFKNADSSK